jgi:hypothetical protein
LDLTRSLIQQIKEVPDVAGVFRTKEPIHFKSKDHWDDVFYVFLQGNYEENMEKVHNLALDFLKKYSTFKVGVFVYFLNNMKGLSKNEVKKLEKAL